MRAAQSLRLARTLTAALSTCLCPPFSAGTITGMYGNPIQAVGGPLFAIYRL